MSTDSKNVDAATVRRVLNAYDESASNMISSLRSKGLAAHLLAEFEAALGDTADAAAMQRVAATANGDLFLRALLGNLVVPSFPEFTARLDALYDDVAANVGGQKASYIPQLYRQDERWWGVAVCTVDGQVWSRGDVDQMYTVQSTVKPLTYGMMVEEKGAAVADRHVGHEPSGAAFNAVIFDKLKRPHNPMINAGAIMTCALLKNDVQDDPAERFDYVLDTMNRLAGARADCVRACSFDNSTFLSEYKTADRNFALAYLMRNNDATPAKCNVDATLQFYFQCCSITTCAKSHAQIAASLASGGVQPLTRERIFAPDTCRSVLSLMYSCGMYDYSGEFAYSIGFPSKSGVAGALMIVIPSVLGICTFSPRLDAQGNSVRGVDFCTRLVRQFNFHVFDSLKGMSNKLDPRLRLSRNEEQSNIVQAIFAASENNLSELHALIELQGVSPSCQDYDKRTPLHLAAAEGRVQAVRFLVEHKADVNKRDRFGETPLDEANKSKVPMIIEMLTAAGGKAGAELGALDANDDQEKAKDK